MGEGRDYWPHFAEQTEAPKLSHNTHQPSHDSQVPVPPHPDLCLAMCYGLGEEEDGTSSAPGQDLGPFSTPAPAQAPALPEALKGPDCTLEVSEQQLHEYMKESFVQVSRSGGWGLWAGGLPGSEGSKQHVLMAGITSEKGEPGAGRDSRTCLGRG